MSRVVFVAGQLRMRIILISVFFTCITINHLAYAAVVTLFDNRVSFELPAGFTQMTEEEIKIKYSRANPPTIAYANESRSVSIAVVYSEEHITSEQLTELKSQMTNLLPRIIPNLEWKKNEILVINRKKWVHFEVISSAIDTDIHNDMFMTDFDGRMLGLNLNATRASYDSFRNSFENVLKILEVNP